MRKRGANVIPALQPGRVLFIVGHASRSGSASFNRALSERRALSVFNSCDFDVGLNKATVFHYGTGETETLGQTSNDPIDRAVVLVVQRSIDPLMLTPWGQDPVVAEDFTWFVFISQFGGALGLSAGVGIII